MHVLYDCGSLLVRPPSCFGKRWVTAKAASREVTPVVLLEIRKKVIDKRFVQVLNNTRT